MTEANALPTDYDALVEEFKKAAGPLEAAVDYVQNGIEMESFRDSRAGKIIIAVSMQAMHSALASILHAETSGQALVDAVMALRVQHRLLNTIAVTIQIGREAERRIQMEDLNEQENPDEQL